MNIEAQPAVKGKKIRSILISQPEPANGRSPYYDVEEKFDVRVDFQQFIHVEGLTAKDFRKQKIDINEFTAVVFTSRHAIDHFFRICEKMKVDISSDLKYFCARETVALYLQKYVQYRKRKIFFPESGRTKDLLEIIKKYKSKETFIVPSSEQSKNDIPNWLKENKVKYKKAIMYQTVCNDVNEVVANGYDMIIFFSPSGVKALRESVPDFEQNNTAIAAFGKTTSKAVEDMGFRLDLKAPTTKAPSMVSALKSFLKKEE